jgi:hypothetical protein
MALLFDMTREERRACVAKMLNCNPWTPEDWPMEIIDRILRRVEEAADRQLRDDVLHIGAELRRKS